MKFNKIFIKFHYYKIIILFINNMIYDFFILGGGICGLYTCYRLLQKNPKYKIIVCEKNDYWGGRIYTSYKKINEITYQMEEGAGRFNDNHKILISLINELGLQNDIIKIGSKTKFIDSKKEFKNKKFKNKNSFTYINKVIKYAIHEDIKTLQQYTFIEYASEKLKKDEVKFMLDSSGYVTDLLLLNAYDACIMFQYNNRENINYFTMKNGMSTIIYFLIKKIKEIMKKTSGKLLLNTEIQDFEYDSKNKIFNLHSSSINFKAKHFICTIPKNNILAFSYFQPYKLLLESVQSVPLCRIYAIYSDKWFKTIEKTTTNNKLKFIIPINKENGLIMISYINGKETNYWKNIMNKDMNKEMNKDMNHSYLNNALKKNIKKVFQIETKDPIYTNFAYWDIGVHLWKPKYDSLLLIDKIIQLNKDIPLYIIGESYSLSQGWVEGSLETSNKFMDILFNSNKV